MQTDKIDGIKLNTESANNEKYEGARDQTCDPLVGSLAPSFPEAA